MSAVNLGVGIKTDSAKKSIQELKALIQSELGGAKARIDVDAASLRSTLTATVKEAFAVKFRVQIDSAALTSDIRAAVSAGLGGGRLPAGIGGGNVQAIQSSIDQILRPAVDQLAIAAQAISRAAGVAEIRPRGSVRATQGTSYVDPETGKRVSVSERLANPLDALAQAEREIAARKEAEVDKARLATQRALLDQRMREIAAAEEREAADQLARAKNLNATQKALADQRIAEIGALERKQEAERLAAIREQAREQLAAAKAYFNAMRFEGGEKYTGKGAQLYAARQTSANFGEQVTREALGSQSFLLSQSGDLEQYLKKVGTAHSDTAEKAKANAAIHRQVKEAMGEVHAAARGLSGSLGLLWTTYGSVVPLVAMAAIGAGMREVFNTGRELEYQLRFVSVLSNNAVVDLGQFAEAIRGTLATPKEAAEAMRGLAQNGLSVRESLQALPSVLNLATAGEMSLQAAALGATGVMAAFNLQVNDLGRVSDVFAKAAAISNTSVTGMVEAMKQASTVGDMYHVSIEETAAGLAILAKRNIDGTAAGTAYRNMWLNLATPQKKASDIMKELGLNLYDSNHQLLQAEDILGKLHDKLATLDEESRLKVISEIFGERGAKSANAILSDFDEYKKALKEIRGEAEGFTRSVVDALSDTTTGRMKALMSDFQLSVASAFNKSSEDVKHFLDSLRGVASSQDLVNTLANLGKAVLSVTQFLVEHGSTVAATFALWKATGWAVTAVQMFRDLRIAAGATTVAVSGLAAAEQAAAVAAGEMAVAERIAIGAVTGGIGLVAALAAEYFLLEGSLSETEKAQRALNAAQADQAARGDANQKAVQEQIKLLETKKKYLLEGKSAAEAQDLAEQEVGKTTVKSYDDAIAAARKHVAELKAQYDEKDRYIKEHPSLPAMGFAAPDKGLSERDNLKQQLDLANAQLQDLYFKRNRAAIDSNDQLRLSEAKSYNDRVTAVNDFNRRIKEALDQDPRLKIASLKLDVGQVPSDPAKFAQFMKDKEAALNSQLKHVDIPTAKRDPLVAAQNRGEEQSLRDQEELLKQNIRFTKELNDVKFSSGRFGPYLTALVQENEAIQNNVRLREFEEQMVRKLQALKAQTPADKQNIENQIAQREHSIEMLKQEIQHTTELARLKASIRDAEQADANIKSLRDLSAKDDADRAEISRKFSQKITDPREQLRQEYAAKTEEEYRSKILEIQQEIYLTEQGRKELADQLLTAKGSEADVIRAEIDASDAHLNKEREILDTYLKQRDAASRSKGDQAVSEYDKSQTAEYGFQRFFKEFQESGQSSADMVYQLMKKTTTGMSDMFAQFCITGKLNFRSFAASIAEEAAKMLANKAITSLLELGISLFGTPTGELGSIGVINNYAGTTTGVTAPPTLAAWGQVMTAYGPMPLDRFAGGGVGGIQRSPKAVIFGEGSRPEAYVPLPDGRTIPVTIQGNLGGGGGDTVVTQTINIESNGNSKVATDVTGERAAELGKMLDAAVRDVIVREKRPGGLLAA